MMVKYFQLKRYKYILFFVVILLTKIGIGQTTAILEEYKAKYPGQHIVMKNHSSKVVIEMVKGKLKLVQNYHLEFLILDQNGLLSLAEETLDHGSFEELTINEAYVLVPKGSSSEKIKVSQIYTQDAQTSGSIFHDGNKETRLIFPRMEIGALRVLDYSLEVSEHKFPFGFNFGSYIPIEHASFEIVSDTSVHLLTNTYFMDKLNLNFNETVVKNTRTTSWVVNNIPTYKQDNGSPNRKYYIPHLLSQIGYYNTKAGRVNVLNDLGDLHQWYFSNIKEVYNEEPNKEIKTIADSITRNLSSELEKVEAVYYWVQDNIKYIAFEEGINGFVPRQPSSIIKKRYGDCKDMAALIYSMLKAVEIKSYLCWIGSRDLPYKYTEFASTANDNHMIAMYKNGENNYFLDATNSFLSYKDVASFTIGKEIFVNLSETQYEVLQLPIPEHSYSKMIDTTVINIDGRKINGTGSTYIGGYYNQMMHPVFYEAQKDKLDEIGSNIFLKGNNSCKVSNVKIENISNRDKPMHLKYNYVVDNYVTSLDKEIYINMVLEKDISSGEFKKDRTSPYEFEFKSSDSYTTILNIPEGYSVKSIPKNTEHKSDLVDFSVTYKTIGNQVFMTLMLDIKSIMIQPDQFDVWNKYYTTSKNNLSQSLVLINNN